MSPPPFPLPPPQHSLTILLPILSSLSFSITFIFLPITFFHFSSQTYSSHLSSSFLLSKEQDRFDILFLQLNQIKCSFSQTSYEMIAQSQCSSFQSKIP